MSCYFSHENELVGYSSRDAGGKARVDVNDILSEMGMSPLSVRVVDNRSQALPFEKMAQHRLMMKNWIDAVSGLRDSDMLIVQFPAIGHTLFFGRVVRELRRKNVKLILLIHDLDTLRMGLHQTVSFKERKRIQLEEATAFAYASAVIVHNDHMAKAVHEVLGYPREKIVSLGLFDYLAPGFHSGVSWNERSDAVMVAGNLSPEKAGYLYSLPVDVHFDLYGVGLDESRVGDNVKYHGSFEAVELPVQLTSRYGLVWDGPMSDTCGGAYGKYLLVNNPHKTSLYLASGVPVIVWNRAAIADMVREVGVGVCVSSLSELSTVLAGVTDEDYAQMCLNAEKIGARLRGGFFTKGAVAKAIEIASRI